jgi:hypothetical protein
MVNRAVKYWALYSLTQGDLSEVKRFEGRRSICCGASDPSMGLDARALPFLMFSGGAAYEMGIDYAKSLEPGSVNSYTPEKVLDLLDKRPINHVEGEEVAEQVGELLRRMEKQGALPEFYRTLYALVRELQKSIEQQQQHVIWQLWFNAFGYLVTQRVGESLALLSYLLLYALMEPGDLASFRMWPDKADPSVVGQPPWAQRYSGGG